MCCLKLLNVIGLILQMSGVLLLAKSDLLTKSIEAARNEIPNNPYLEAYRAARDGREPYITQEERKYDNLVEQQKYASSPVSTYRSYLFLIVGGMVVQLIAVILG